MDKIPTLVESAIAATETEQTGGFEISHTTNPEELQIDLSQFGLSDVSINTPEINLNAAGDFFTSKKFSKQFGTLTEVEASVRWHFYTARFCSQPCG